MMRNTIKQKLKVILSCGLLILLLSGCDYGAKLSSQLILNEDLSGERVIYAAINETAVSENFDGTMEELHALIESKLPEGMEMSFSEEDATYSFTLPFDSTEDYVGKVSAILSWDPQVDVTGAGTMWTDGISYYENFTDKELMSWLSQALVDEGKVSSSNSSYIFEGSEGSLSYDGQDYVVGNRYSVDSITFLGLDQISVKTNVIDLEHFDRSVQFNIPLSTLERKPALEDWMNERQPAGAALAWDSYEGGRSVSYQIKNADLQQLRSFTEALFGENNYSAESYEGEAESPFLFLGGLNETITLSDFGVADANPSQFRATCTLPQGNMILTGTGDPAATSGTETVLVDTPAYGSVYLPGQLEKSYPVRRMEISMKKSGSGPDFTRSDKIYLVTAPDAADEEKIRACLDGMDQMSTALLILTMENTEDQGYCVGLSAHGEYAAVEEIFSHYGSMNMDYMRDGGLKLKSTESYTENADLNYLLARISPEFMGTYSLDMGSGASCLQNESGFADGYVEGSTLYGSFADPYYRVSWIGTRLNLVFVAMLILTPLGLILLAVGLFSSGILKMGKTIRPQEAAVQPEPPQLPSAEDVSAETETSDEVEAFLEAVSEELEEEAVMEAETNVEEEASTGTEQKICKDCGHQLNPGAKFCPVCGSRVE